ncbi:MAG: hypothetical protein GF328_11010, partial [Candidatus Latescibacteria bacterium]|nr:hypothetical protein [Candidatus Latescibacterota bacterium]
GEALLSINGRPEIVHVHEKPEGRVLVTTSGLEIEVELADPSAAHLEGRMGAAGADARIELRSPMHGTVVQIPVAEGATVEEEAPLVVLEAMKMQNALTSPARAVVRRILVEQGQTVEGDALLVELERVE